MSKFTRTIIIILLVALSFSVVGCIDNGGTHNPDNGCIGQGAGFESCQNLVGDTMQKLDKVNDDLFNK